MNYGIYLVDFLLCWKDTVMVTGNPQEVMSLLQEVVLLLGNLNKPYHGIKVYSS